MKEPIKEDEGVQKLLEQYSPEIEKRVKKETYIKIIKTVKEIAFIGVLLFLGLNSFLQDRKAMLNFAWQEGYNSALRLNSKELWSVDKQVIDSRKWEARIDFQDKVNGIYQINILERWETLKSDSSKVISHSDTNN
jgi:hypothetical protein